ncbi:MAG: hypothetical protein KDB47_06955 [Mycobacterium sp.]|nr:hypothetical protein [Mycobacterium sp.]
MTGELADPLHRDLAVDGITLDDLGWRDLWAYVTAAPPGTAIGHHRSDGWTAHTHIAAEQLSDMRELLWRYTAVHFKNGGDMPFPSRVPHPGETPAEPGPTWETATIEQMVPPEIRALLRGG